MCFTWDLPIEYNKVPIIIAANSVIPASVCVGNNWVFIVICYNTHRKLMLFYPLIDNIPPSPPFLLGRLGSKLLPKEGFHIIQSVVAADKNIEAILKIAHMYYQCN